MIPMQSVFSAILTYQWFLETIKTLISFQINLVWNSDFQCKLKPILYEKIVLYGFFATNLRYYFQVRPRTG